MDVRLLPDSPPKNTYADVACGRQGRGAVQAAQTGHRAVTAGGGRFIAYPQRTAAFMQHLPEKKAPEGTSSNFTL